MYISFAKCIKLCCRSATSAKITSDVMPSRRNASMKYMIMQMCVSKTVLNITPTCAKILNPTQCLKMKRQLDGLLDSWKIFARRNISIEMEEISANLDIILQGRMYDLLVFLQNIMVKDPKKLIDFERWIVNGLLFGPAEAELTLETIQSSKTERRCYQYGRY